MASCVSTRIEISFVANSSRECNSILDLSAAEVFTTTITGTAFSSNVLFIDFVSSGLTVVHAGYTSPRSSSTVSVVAMSKIPTPQ